MTRKTNKELVAELVKLLMQLLQDPAEAQKKYGSARREKKTRYAKSSTKMEYGQKKKFTIHVDYY
jgi:DNA-binding protein H-NS